MTEIDYFLLAGVGAGGAPSSFHYFKHGLCSDQQKEKGAHAAGAHPSLSMVCSSMSAGGPRMHQGIPSFRTDGQICRIDGNGWLAVEWISSGRVFRYPSVAWMKKSAHEDFILDSISFDRKQFETPVFIGGEPLIQPTIQHHKVKRQADGSSG